MPLLDDANPFVQSQHARNNCILGLEDLLLRYVARLLTNFVFSFLLNKMVQMRTARFLLGNIKK